MDDDSCVMKYIEIAPLDKFQDCLDVTAVKREPVSMKVFLLDFDFAPFLGRLFWVHLIK